MKFCDEAKQEPCMTPGLCTKPCHHDFSAIRKIKPYPAVPPDPGSVQEEFDGLMAKLGWVIGAFLVVIFANLSFALYILLRML